MNVDGHGALVTGGASGLGRAAAEALVAAGAHVVIADLPSSAGAEVARQLGPAARFIPTDVTEPAQLEHAAAVASERVPLRAIVHTAGRGGPVRLVNKDGTAGDASRFLDIVRTNLLGTFHVTSVGAAVMSRNELVDGERGAIVLTASVAAFEGQIGQSAYAASKAGVVGLTLCAARDLASCGIRVCTIAPGLMDTPMLAGLRDEIRDSLAQTVPHPHRLGMPQEYASLALEILRNGYLNGETLRLDGAIRMAPR